MAGKAEAQTARPPGLPKFHVEEGGIETGEGRGQSSQGTSGQTVVSGVK